MSCVGSQRAARLEEIGREKGVDPGAVEIWFADEARVGQKKAFVSGFGAGSGVLTFMGRSYPFTLDGLADRPWRNLLTASVG